MGTFLTCLPGEGSPRASLGQRFKWITLIDRITPSLEDHSGQVVLLTGDAADPQVLNQVKTQADLISCVAGFHHLLEGTGEDSTPALTRKFRVRVLSQWRQLLVEGGRLIVADVPAAGCQSGVLSGGPPPTAEKHREERGHETTQCPLQLLGSSESSWDPPVWPATLAGYVDMLKRQLARQRWTEPEPADFFDHFVARQSPIGHVAYFQAAEDLACCLREAGFCNVGAAVVPTPWLFAGRVAALWFVRELLTIGEESIPAPAFLSNEQGDALEEAIELYLGHRTLADGTYLVQWKLMYVWGERPGRTHH